MSSFCLSRTDREEGVEYENLSKCVLDRREL